MILGWPGLENSICPLAMASGNSRWWMNFLICRLLVLKGEWNLLSGNKEFMDCAIETGNSHMHKGIGFILSGNLVINLLKSVKRMCKLHLSIATLSGKTRQRRRIFSRYWILASCFEDVFSGFAYSPAWFAHMGSITQLWSVSAEWDTVINHYLD